MSFKMNFSQSHLSLLFFCVFVMHLMVVSGEHNETFYQNTSEIKSIVSRSFQFKNDCGLVGSDSDTIRSSVLVAPIRLQYCICL